MNHIEEIKKYLKCNDDYAFLVLLIISDQNVHFLDLSRLAFLRLVKGVDVVIAFNVWVRRTERLGTLDDMILFHNRVFPKIKRG